MTLEAVIQSQIPFATIDEHDHEAVFAFDRHFSDAGYRVREP